MATSSTDLHQRVESRAAARTVDARKIYGKGQTEVRALDGVSVEFETGRFTAIMGPSGSGKSTLLQCTAGLDTLTSGKAFIGDADVSLLNDQKLTILRRDRVGFIFQAYNLVPTLTALENITLPLTLANRQGDQAWIDRVVQTVGLAGRLKHRPSELSGGQHQRVAVARALATRPDIIFADEPTGNLDSRAGAEILQFMRQAVDAMNQTIVMVTHDPVAASYADRSQLRSAIRWESVIIALQGTFLGLLIGVFFGWALVQALADEGIDTFRLPVSNLAVVVVLAAIAGVLAAVAPSRRAAKLNVLAAIAST